MTTTEVLPNRESGERDKIARGTECATRYDVSIDLVYHTD